MNYSDYLSFRFNPETRIAELSAKKRIEINSIEDHDLLCSGAAEILDEITRGEKCYLAVDISNIIIDPALADRHFQKMAGLKERYVYDGGLVRYGYEITRVTLKLAGLKSGELPVIFNRRSDAIEYLEQLAEKQNQEMVKQ